MNEPESVHSSGGHSVMKTNRERSSGRQLRRRPGRAAALAASLTIAAATACNFDVVNPGPVEDSFLNDPGAHEAIVNGMHRQAQRGVTYVAHWGGIVGREIKSVGGINRFGVRNSTNAGRLDPFDASGHWDRAQVARYVAEAGVERLRKAMGPDFSKSNLTDDALVWIGYSNRLLGENMCVAVFSGGKPEDRMIHFPRAEKAFTEALAIAQATGDRNAEYAALGGRASVRVWLKNWKGAAEDAAKVPKNFKFQVLMGTVGDDQYNVIAWANADQPYRYLSVAPWFRQYYLDSGDPRVAWFASPKPASVPSLGKWEPPLKYFDRLDPINLATGREMLLIRAEAALAGGDIPGAMAFINQLRADVKVPPRTASNAEEAWLALKLERAVELYLEARRIGDVWRWKQNNTPGKEPATLDTGNNELCFPPGQDEVDANPNLNVTP